MSVSLGLLKRDEMSKAKALYISAFPAEERAPFIMLRRKNRLTCADWISIYDENEWAGFFYNVTYGDLTYVFYFAIDENRRGKGVGSAALKELQSVYRGSRLFLAIEQIDESAENYNERVHRKAFYMRNGFKDLKQKLREGNVIYELLGTGGYIAPEEYRALIDGWTGTMLGRMVTMQIIA